MIRVALGGHIKADFTTKLALVLGGLPSGRDALLEEQVIALVRHLSDTLHLILHAIMKQND